jgi:disulfide bond formation protein DsbB
MRRALRLRFWLETSMAAMTSIMFMTTLVWRNWIELVFKVEPDAGNGSLEWLIVGLLFVVATALFFLARYEWRLARMNLSNG